MKRLSIVAALLIAASLLLVGCCTKTLPNGTITRNPWNCIATVNQKLCNPSQAQQDAAASAVAFIEMAMAYVPANLQAIYLTAKGTFLLVKPGLCVGLDQLQAAIEQFDDAVRQMQAATKVAGKANFTVASTGYLSTESGGGEEVTMRNYGWKGYIPAVGTEKHAYRGIAKEVPIPDVAYGWSAPFRSQGDKPFCAFYSFCEVHYAEMIRTGLEPVLLNPLDLAASYKKETGR